MGEGPKMEMMYFQDFTYQEVERTKKFLKDKWLGENNSSPTSFVLNFLLGKSGKFQNSDLTTLQSNCLPKYLDICRIDQRKIFRANVN